MDYALRQALKKFDARRTEKLGPSESAVFTPDEKGAAMIADVFLPIVHTYPQYLLHALLCFSGAEET